MVPNRATHYICILGLYMQYCNMCLSNELELNFSKNLYFFCRANCYCQNLIVIAKIYCLLLQLITFKNYKLHGYTERATYNGLWGKLGVRSCIEAMYLRIPSSFVNKSVMLDSERLINKKQLPNSTSLAWLAGGFN